MKLNFHKIKCVDPDFLDEFPAEVKKVFGFDINKVKESSQDPMNIVVQVSESNDKNKSDSVEHSTPLIVIDTFCKTETKTDKTDNLNINSNTTAASREDTDEVSENNPSSEAVKNNSPLRGQTLKETDLKNAFVKGNYHLSITFL